MFCHVKMFHSLGDLNQLLKAELLLPDNLVFLWRKMMDLMMAFFFPSRHRLLVF